MLHGKISRAGTLPRLLLVGIAQFRTDRSLLNDECAKLKLLDKGTSNRSNRSSLLENCTANELERHQRILQSFIIRGGSVAKGQFLYHQYSELPGLPCQCFEEYRKHCWRKIRQNVYYDRENKERRQGAPSNSDSNPSSLRDKEYLRAQVKCPRFTVEKRSCLPSSLQESIRIFLSGVFSFIKFRTANITIVLYFGMTCIQ